MLVSQTHSSDAQIEANDIKGVARNVVYGVFPWGLSRAVPVFVMLIVGNQVVQNIVAAMPQWLTKGLSVAGGILPVVGIAILLRFLPTKRFISYLLIGFFAAAYLKVPMLGVALLGVALAFIYYMRSGNDANQGTDSDTKEGHENELGEYED